METNLQITPLRYTPASNNTEYYINACYKNLQNAFNKLSYDAFKLYLYLLSLPHYNVNKELEYYYKDNPTNIRAQGTAMDMNMNGLQYEQAITELQYYNFIYYKNNKYYFLENPNDFELDT